VYIVNSNNQQARGEGVRHILWGVVGLVVMLSAYSILSIVVATFGLQDELEAANEGNVVIPPPNNSTNSDADTAPSTQPDTGTSNGTTPDFN
jgi:hypothetical protein